jgi:hypothetical protein
MRVRIAHRGRSGRGRRRTGDDADQRDSQHADV